MPGWIGMVSAWYLAASVWAVVAYGLDKRSAGLGRRRVSEKTLLAIALAGGWPGALLATRWFRHKTRKVAYRLVMIVIVALHVSAWVYLLSFSWTGPNG